MHFASPSSIDDLLRQAAVLHRRGRFAEAQILYDAILDRSPRQVDALHLLGVARCQAGRFVEGVVLFERVIALQPAMIEAHSNRGRALRALGRYDLAADGYRNALRLAPERVDLLIGLADALREAGLDEDAIAAYDRALASQPQHAVAWNHRGMALSRRLRFAAALESFDHAVALGTPSASLLNNRTVALNGLNRFEEALACADSVLDRAPRDTAALSNRAYALAGLNRAEEGLASVDAALATAVANAEVLNCRGSLLRRLHRYDEACVAFEQAIDAQPCLADSHYNLGLCLLAMGNMEQGWREYEWRLRTPLAPRPRSAAPRWQVPRPPEGRTVLVSAEQGYGDAIQFCRYVSMLAARGNRVLLETRQPLRRLFSTLDGAAQLVGADEPTPPHDCQCTLLSLPCIFATSQESVPAQVPYLSVPPAEAARWAERLRGLRRPWIGVACSGNPLHPNDRNRSAPLAAFAPVIPTCGTVFLMQKGLHADDEDFLAAERAHALEDGGDNRVLHSVAGGIVDLRAYLGDFADTAAALVHMDLVICVDTALAHLAGALARPVWILLPHNPDWRWMLGRADSPWYPSARLFRQSRPQDWGGIMERVSLALRSHAPGQSS